jgi:hypothetical protein
VTADAVLRYNYERVRRTRFRNAIGRRVGPGNRDPVPPDIERWYQTWKLLCDDSNGGVVRLTLHEAAKLTQLATEHEHGFIVINNHGTYYAATEGVAVMMICGPTRIIPIVNGG